jgi:putative transcriptional regulator
MAKKVFDSIMRGLKEYDGHLKGETRLKTTTYHIEPTVPYTAKKVKTLRQELKLPQTAFACLCGVSNKTVEAWEAGTNVPNGSARRLFELMEKDPQILTRSRILSISKAG